MMMNKNIFFSAACVLFSISVFAQHTIELKSGEKITGILIASLKDGYIKYASKNYPKEIAPLFISDPFKRKIEGLFSTHPNINERIKRLRMM